MATLKTGISVPAVILSLVAASSASAESRTAKTEPAVAQPARDALMRTYATPQEAIAALRSAGRYDLLSGSVQGFTQAAGNPSGSLGTSDWYALFGGECCLVVLGMPEESSIVAGETPLSAALQRGEGVAIAETRRGR